MIKSNQGWSWQFVLAGALATGGVLHFCGSRALGQNLPIVPDGTLGAERSVVNNGVITGGAQRQGNLFHSFSDFNVGQGVRVDFANPAGIDNILSRVTGKNPSAILGTLGVLGKANLFLLNPNGILFGPKAQLDLQGGSFVGTTASGIRFLDGGEFSISSADIQNKTLLTVNPSALLFNQIPGPIVNQANLRVKPTQDLFLVGGDVTLQGGNLKAPGGRVELGGLAQTGEVDIQDITFNSRNLGFNFPKVGLHFPDGVALANVSLTNAAIDVGSSSRLAGNLYITAGNQISLVNSQLSSQSNNDLTSGFSVIQLAATEGSVLLNNSTISTTNFGTGFSGDIRISAHDQVSIFNNSSIFSRGNSGNIFIGEPKYNLLTPRSVTLNNAKLNTTGLNSGIAGNIIIRSHDQIAIEHNSEITSQSENDTPSPDEYGVIKLSATEGSVLLNNSTISTTNFRSGYSGDVRISAPGQVSIVNGSSIFSQGNSGNILIGEPKYDLLTPRSVTINNARLNTTGLNSGIAGNIIIRSHDQIAIEHNSGITSQSENDTPSPGEYGVIKLAATEGSVLLNNSTMSTTNSSSGYAGDIFIDAANLISVDNQSGIFSNGYFGRILITVTEGSFALDNQSKLETVNSGSSVAGDVSISARDAVSILNGGRISTDGNSGRIFIGRSDVYDTSFSPKTVRIDDSVFTTRNIDLGERAGDVSIDAIDNVSITNSDVSSSTLGSANAGSVSIKADSVSAANSGIYSQVASSDATGEGGDIDITAGSFSLTDGASVSTSTYGPGDAGIVKVRADRVFFNNSSGILSAVLGTNATGNAGEIGMWVGSLEISNGSRVTTETIGKGSAGLILVQASKDVSLRGNGSGIFSSVDSGSTNTDNFSGAIVIDARSLLIRDGAQVNVDNQGSGVAGDIEIDAREDIILRDGGQIRAVANSGLGGNILINQYIFIDRDQQKPGDFVVLVNGSQISTEAGQGVGVGNGGNVLIDSRYVIAAPFNDNNIDANAALGQGGYITVNASRLYDIAKRDTPSNLTNDITASSDIVGLNGIVSTTGLNPDPTQGLSNLPTDPVDPTRLIGETCAPRGGITERPKNQFIVTRRGGLPPDPNAAFPGEAVVTDEGNPNQQNNQPNSPHSTNPASSPPVATASPQRQEQPNNRHSTNSTSATPTAIASPQPPENQPDNPGSTNSTSITPTATASSQQPIIEAQGWVYDKNGDIKFTNEAPTVTPSHSELIPASTCYGLSTQP